MKPELWYLLMTIIAMLLSMLMGASNNIKDRNENIKLRLENARLRKQIDGASKWLKDGE